MNPDAFYNKYQGQSLLYAPSPAREDLRGQCVQPVMFYVTEFWGKQPIWDDAYPWFAGGRLADQYDRIANNPNDPNQLPPKGAVMVWGPNLPGSGGYGHVAVLAYVNAGGATFVSYDSNWGGKTLHPVTHNWSYVVGWLVPKGSAGSVPQQSQQPAQQSSGGIEMIQDINQARQAYGLLRPDGNVTDGELNGTAGRRSWQQFANDAQAEVNQRNAVWASIKQENASMHDTINVQNQAITDFQLKLNDATASNAEKQKALDEMLEKVGSTNSDLATAHDTIKDLQTKLESAQTQQTSGAPAAQKPDLVTKLIAFLLRKKS